MMPYRIILLFGAIAGCARAGVIASADDDDGGGGLAARSHRARVFARLPGAAEAVRGVIRHGLSSSSLPLYFVSNDLYPDTCTNDRCNDVADLFLKSVKKSVSPCDDFYAHACGRKQSKRSKMRSLTKEIREILEQQPQHQQQHHHHHHHQHNHEETKSLALERRFYKSCMDQQEGDHKTREEFSRILEVSRGLGLFEPGRKLTHDWQAADGLYAGLGFEHAFFNVHVTRDPANDDVNLISIMPPSPLYFYSVHSLLKYKNFTGIKSNLLGEYHKSDYVVDYEDVIDFNNALHEILPPIGMFEENITTLKNNRMTIGEWQRVYDLETEDFEMGKGKNHIDWLKLLNVFLKTAVITVDHNEKIVVKKLDYFTKLAKLLEKTPAVTVEKYIHFKFLTQISKYLSPSLASYFENVRDRSTFCIKQSDNQLIGATYEYIKRYVPREHKNYAEKIAENVRKSLVSLLSDAEWMDRETKFYAANKLRSLDLVIGYPEWQINRTFVNDYYGNLHLHANFFDNVIKYKRKSLVHELRGLKHPHTFDPMTMSKKLGPLIYHFEVNSHMNRILFPTEYLNEKKYKLFGTELPSSINYGSFGSMLGSILYDYVSLTDNLKYNEFYTRTIEGLSKDTIDAYKTKEKCLSNQLINYKKSASQFDQPLASVIDRDTIQVDKIYEKMTGLRAAFEAFRKIKPDKQEQLPGFESTTSNQLFFLSYAERICEVGDIYDKYDTYEMSLKVNGVVSNLEVFSDVYQCTRDSPMNGDVKCELFS